MVGIFVGGQPRHGVAAEKPDRSGLSHRRRSDLSVPDEAVLSAPHLATSPPSERLACRPGDCRAVACPRHLAKSAVFLLGASRRTRSIPWPPLVLFHQRAGAPLPEPALPARLQYGPPSVVLAASFRVVVSLVRILSRCRSATCGTLRSLPSPTCGCPCLWLRWRFLPGPSERFAGGASALSWRQP